MRDIAGASGDSLAVGLGWVEALKIRGREAGQARRGREEKGWSCLGGEAQGRRVVFRGWCAQTSTGSCALTRRRTRGSSTASLSALSFALGTWPRQRLSTMIVKRSRCLRAQTARGRRIRQTTGRGESPSSRYSRGVVLVQEIRGFSWMDGGRGGLWSTHCGFRSHLTIHACPLFVRSPCKGLACPNSSLLALRYF